MKATCSYEAKLLEELEKRGYAPGRWDRPGVRILDLKNKAGYTILRVCLDREGEDQLVHISIYKLDGLRSQITEWACENMSARMPLPALLALFNNLV